MIARKGLNWSMAITRKPGYEGSIHSNTPLTNGLSDESFSGSPKRTLTNQIKGYF